tara:strand:+ start:395 stop:1045 length:651 start_codon:yes stop_codon:yes gene_type:complete
MIKNNTSTIILGLIMLVGFYLLYDSQDSTEQRLMALEKQLSDLEGKIDTRIEEEIVNNLQLEVSDYQELNVVTKDTEDFTEELNNRIEENKKNLETLHNDALPLDSDSLLKNLLDMPKTEEIIKLGVDTIDTQDVSEPLDTLCYGLPEKYKIINFSRNGARLRDRGRPGSKLVSIKDTLNYDGFKYVLLEVNSTQGYMLFMDINNSVQKDCYFFKD